MRSARVFGCSLVVATLVSGCGDERAAGPTGELAIGVAPLSLEGLSDACYSLAVTNETGDPVWSRAEVCASRYGSPEGDLTYVGPCDTSDPNEDGDADNTVTLKILRLVGEEEPLSDWQDPCAAPHNPNGCQLEVVCTENADQRVVFDLTILRDARQGFFDVAVSFEDIFCSAKVDCVDSSGPLMLVHGPDGQRVQSVVLAFACTDGDAATGVNDSTHLYLDPVAIRCGAQRYEISPWLGPGNLYPAAGTPPAPLVQAMTFRGIQTLGTSPDLVDAVYWNTALGLDMAFFAAQTTGTTCVLETRATASKGPLTDGLTPSGAIHPVIEVAVPLNSGSTITCRQHPLNAAPPGAGVSTAYAGTSALPGPLSFAAVARRSASGVVESFYVDACAACDPNASCFPAAATQCVCLPGYYGDGETCSPCPTIEHCSGVVSCNGPLDATCSGCESGYDGPTCVNIDECQEIGTCAANTTCLDSEGSFLCLCEAPFVTQDDECRCAPGYYQNGTTCFVCPAIPQCEGQITCDSATISSCDDCADGYEGQTCTDINECGVAGPGCDTHATCQNFPGTFTCTCDEHYYGDGASCTKCGDITFCLVDETCSGPGDSSCGQCADGFTGPTCNDIDECGTAGPGCGANTTCQNLPGTFSCTCLPGYSGDPNTGCTLDTFNVTGAGTDVSPRTWSNGTFATSCEAYRRPSSPYIYSGSIGSGVYRISPGGSPFNAYCDMDNDGGGWTLVVNISGSSNLHGKTTGAYGDITSPGSGAAKLADTVINQLSTIGYWRYDCSSRNAFVKNTANTWVSQRSNGYNWSIDRNRDGTFEYGANRDGYVFSDYLYMAADHTNYAAMTDTEGNGCYLAPSWNLSGHLWAR